MPERSWMRGRGGITWAMIYLWAMGFGASARAQQSRAGGGSFPLSRCILEPDRAAIAVEIRARSAGVASRTTDVVLFGDPVGAGGTKAPGKTIVNYVDLAAGTGLRDYLCGQVTYDGHAGTDVTIVDFYEMDDGVPVLSAAAGVVVQVHDGEFDRQTAWLDGVRANSVVIRHADGSEAMYLHFRKNSIRVHAGDAVAAADTLGLIGSSGFSSGPHLHFELHENGIRDPYSGPCQPEPSRWKNQLDYILDWPFELMQHGLTLIPVTWASVLERPPSKQHIVAGSRVYSWLRLRNVQSTDRLAWELYANGNKVNEYAFSPGATYVNSYWYTRWDLPVNASLYGAWQFKIYRNGDQIAEQPFAYDANPNQPPTVPTLVYRVQKGGRMAGEFQADDPDGSVFWYQLTSPPRAGNLIQDGGRGRRFAYQPEAAFVGQDTVVYYAIDDEEAAGPPGMLIFEVSDLPVSVTERRSAVPAGLQLFQNYPNPFNPETSIRFSLPVAAEVRIIARDMLGRYLGVLAAGRFAAGEHRVLWDARGLPAGIYFIEALTERYRKRIKSLLLR